MKRHVIVSAITMAGLSVLVGSSAFATGPALDATNHSQWDENAYYSGFGGALPPGIVEGSSGFSTIGDYSGRTVALATPDLTTNTVDNSPLTTISTGLFSGTDVNLYGINITNPSTFSASVPSTTLILALFNSNGGAIAASIGGTADALTGANTGITAPGGYWIGIANSTEYPQNAEAQNLFNLSSGVAGVYTPAAGITDLALASNPVTAWALPASDTTNALITNTSFVAPSSTITLTGTGFAVVPEPTSLSLVGCAAFGLLSRRRRVARS